MPLGNSPNDRQTHALTWSNIGMSPFECLKDFFLMAGGNAQTVVAHEISASGLPRGVGLIRDANFNQAGSVGIAVLHGIADEICEQLLQCRGISVAGGQRCDLNFHLSLKKSAAHGFNDAINHRLEINEATLVFHSSHA